MKMRKKIFYKFVISYSVILLFALLINLFAFYNYQREASLQSETYIRVFLSQIQFSFDEKMHNIHSIIDNTRLNPSVRTMMLTGGTLNRYTRYTAFEIVTSLRALTTANSHVDSIIIVYEDFDMFITGSTVFHSFEEFYSLSAHMHWDRASWQALFEDVGFIKYSGPVVSRDRYIFTVIRPIMIGGARTPSAHVLVNFHNDIFRDHIGEIIDLQDGLMYISDRNGNLIMSEGSEYLLEHTYNISVDDPSPRPITILNRPYIQHHLFSQSQNLKYVFILPIEPFFARGINQLIVILSGGMILFGGIMCFVIAKYNANPITNLTEFLAQINLLPENDTNHGELEYIQNAVDAAVHEYANIKNEFTRYIPMLQTAMVSDVLKGNLASRADADKELEALGIEFPCSWYSVILFEYQGDGSKTLMEYNSINIQLRNLIYDYFTDGGVVYVCDLDAGMVGGLLNLDYDIESRRHDVRKGMKALTRHIQEVYGTTITITVGGSSQEFDDIPKLYNKAVNAMTHQLFNSPGQFAFFEEMRFGQESFAFSDSVQKYLVVNLKAGNVENVMKALARATEDISGELAMPSEYVKYAFIDLSMLLHKTASSLGIDVFALYEEELGFNPYEAIGRSKNVSIMQDLVMSLYFKTATEIANRMADLKIPLIENIKTYISENYHNPDLSLSLIAEHFNINPSYLSSYFKKSTGENFVNYVNTLRLENACRLLEEDDLQVNDIAYQVGYSSSSIFITNFKKMYGVTPGAYRGGGHQ